MIEESLNDDDRQLEEFMLWIRDNKRLPNNLDAVLLQRYLAVYENDLKKSQDLLLLNLSIRKSAPHMFFNRDVSSLEFQRASKTMQISLLPKLAANGSRVLVIRLINSDASQFYYVDIVRMALMIFDAYFTTLDDDSKKSVANEISFVIDGKGVSFRHFMEIVRNFKAAKLYLRYIQEAAPFNIKSLHFINGSVIVDKIFSLIRPLLKKELHEVIHFHGHDIESLQKMIPIDVLPSEYGGGSGSIDGMHTQMLDLLQQKKDYLGDDSNWKLLD